MGLLIRGLDSKRALVSTAKLALTALAVLVAAASQAVEPEPADGFAYPVDRIVLEYTESNPELPPVAELEMLTVDLNETGRGYVAARSGVPSVTLPIGGIPKGSVLFGSAIRAIGLAVVEEFAELGIGGVVVAPNPSEVASPSGQDLRPDGVTDLRMMVLAGRVRGVTSLGQGERWDNTAEVERVDNPVHRRIREGSPLQPADPGDLIRIDELEEYTARLNRHPGRRVEAQLSPGRDPGTTYVDYQVLELKPWFAFVQGSNTGTEQTTKWRERFGFLHNQLTGRDDILRLDYVTGNFDEVNVVVGSYEAPLFSLDRVRWGVNGSWSEFDSSEVGVSSFINRFTGSQWHVGAQVAYNFFQYRELFLDVVLGARWQEVKVHNQFFDVKGDSPFFLPQLGLRLERKTLKSSLFGSLGIEMNLADLANTAKGVELAVLGRLDPDRDFEILHFDLSYSFFLEPLIYGDDWDDPATPRSSTLAHEILLRTEGQFSFDNRLIPEYQTIAGGLYTVRGYPQSITAGDDVYIGHVEYMLHIPQLFGQRAPVDIPMLGTFRYASPQVYVSPDWDLIFRVFFDAAQVRKNDRTAFEANETLRGVGAGLELRIKRNLSLRFDWGHALDGVRGGLVEKGNNEYYGVVTLLW
jgi:hemolysin activation/secretion protein